MLTTLTAGRYSIQLAKMAYRIPLVKSYHGIRKLRSDGRALNDSGTTVLDIEGGQCVIFYRGIRVITYTKHGTIKVREVRNLVQKNILNHYLPDGYEVVINDTIYYLHDKVNDNLLSLAHTGPDSANCRAILVDRTIVSGRESRACA